MTLSNNAAAFEILEQEFNEVDNLYFANYNNESGLVHSDDENENSTAQEDSLSLYDLCDSPLNSNLISSLENTGNVSDNTVNDEENYDKDTKIDVSNNELNLEKNDEEEDELTKNMFGPKADSCCELKCNTELPKSLVQAARKAFMNLTKKQQDLVLLAHLEANKEHIKLKEIYEKRYSKKSKKKCQQPKTRSKIHYFFRGLEICRKMYWYLYNIRSSNRFEVLQKHYMQCGLTPRQHGLIGKQPTRVNTISQSTKDEVIQFIIMYANKYAISLPGRMPNFQDFRVLKLPSVETKSSVYKIYRESKGVNAVSNRSFRNLWCTYVPYVITTPPNLDLCEICRYNILEIQKTANVSPDARAEKLTEAMNHLKQANEQFSYYNSWRERRDDNCLVLAFDFAQDFSYPSSGAQQIGQTYFKNLRKCSLFGIVNECNRIQMSYLTDESNDIGKGPNMTISCLHHYLEHVSVNKINTLVLFADNYARENIKTCPLIKYLQWRVDVGKNTEIFLNFLLTTHTKFTPDSYFGRIKTQYAQATQIDTLQDILNCVENSTLQGFNIAISTSENMRWFRWDTFLDKFYKPLPDASKCLNFSIDSTGIKAKEFPDSKLISLEFDLRMRNLNSTKFPEVIQPTGMSLERQWYLYNHVRSLVSNESNADSVAPKPTEELRDKSKRKSKKQKKKNKEPTSESVMVKMEEFEDSLEMNNEENRHNPLADEEMDKSEMELELNNSTPTFNTILIPEMQYEFVEDDDDARIQSPEKIRKLK